MLVLNGGNSTCQGKSQPTPIGMGAWAKFSEIVEGLNTRGEIQFNYLASCYENSDATIHYVSNDNPEDPIAVDLEEYYNVVNDMAYLDPDGYRFFTGHSYGGWLALKTLVQADYEVDTLYSNDPISRKHCTFSNPAQCTRAPTDISTSEYELIADKTDEWHNFYETRTWYLHSSAIPQADENLKFNVSHTQMDDLDELWNPLADRINRVLNLAVNEI
jgi:predicted alpha/beta hydrolase family esterase